MIPQNIRVQVSSEELDLIVTGKKAYTLINSEVVSGDYITFVLKDKTNTQPTVKQVSVIDETKTEDGYYIVGLLPPEYGTLVPFFTSGRFVLGYGIEKTISGISLLSPGAYLPPLSSPPVPFEQVSDVLNINKWPDGQYSIVIHAESDDVEAGEQQLELMEILVSARTKDGDDDMFVEVDQIHLYAGSLVDIDGNSIEAYFGPDDVEDEEDGVGEKIEKIQRDFVGEDGITEDDEYKEDNKIFDIDEDERDSENWAQDQVNDVLDGFTSVDIKSR